MNSLGTGFFQSVDGAPAEGYRAPRILGDEPTSSTNAPRLCLLTGEYGAQLLSGLVSEYDVEVQPVANQYFGGNIKVAGLLTGPDIARTMLDVGLANTQFVIPDVCLSEGRFLDGSTPAELPAFVDIVPTSGIALREYLDTWRSDRSKRP
jgi:hypothetical protein